MVTDTIICHRCAYEAPHGDSQTFCPKDGTHLIQAGEHRKSPRDPFLGTTIGGKYPILGMLGQGGMGAVYRSVQPMVDREVALKLILPTPGLDTEVAGKRFLREAQAIAAVSHPSIVTLHDFGAEDDGTLFMVLELVRGLTLSEALRAGSLDWVGLVDVICEVLSALEAAHAKGLIHRDLKPDNVMLLHTPTEHHGLKVLDFGLARVSDTATAARLTRTGAVFGTPQYMSPEQSVGHDVDGRADLYSVGVMLYEGLAGRVPFDSDRPLAVLRAQIEAAPPPLPDHVPAALVALVMKALAKEREDRHADAAQMRAELRAMRDSLDLDLAPTRKWDPDETGDSLGTLMGIPGSSSPDAAAVTGDLPAPEPIPPSIAPPRPPQQMAPSLRTLGDATGELETTEPAPKRGAWIWAAAAAGVAAMVALGISMQEVPPPKPKARKPAARPVVLPEPAPPIVPDPAEAVVVDPAAAAAAATEIETPDAGVVDPPEKVTKRKKKKKKRATDEAEDADDGVVYTDTVSSEDVPPPRPVPMPAPLPTAPAAPAAAPTPSPPPSPPPVATPAPPAEAAPAAPKRRRLDLSKRKLQ